MLFLLDGDYKTGDEKLAYLVDTGILLHTDVQPLEPEQWLGMSISLRP
jgi:hypothetical protein